MSSANTRSIGPLDPSGPAPLPLHPGDLVAGRYEVLRLLGSGGSAFVYAVRDRKIGDEIALKLLRDERRSDIDVERSRREAEFARGSSSPRLVRSFDLGECDGLVFLTMELVSGGSLRDLLRRGALPVDEAVRLACEILEALAELHRLDIVHRDLKPGNLLLTPDGHVKLSDFGIARRWTDEEARLTRTGLPVGTVDYLSPEQAAAENVDPRSDLYSLGVVLFEMLTGRVPFEGPSAVGSIVMRLHRRAGDVRKLRPETPRWLAAIVARLLETKRQERYASAEEVLEDIRRKRTRVPWRRIYVSIAVLLILGALGLGGWWIAHRDELQLVADGDWGMRAVDRNGDTLWRRSDTTPQRTALVHRRKVKELVTVVAPSPERSMEPSFARTLSFLDPRTGTVMRRREVSAFTLLWFPHHSNRFGTEQVLASDLNGDDYDEAILTYINHYWPSFIVVDDLHRDEVRPVFVASGHHRVEAIEDIDGDGVAELILVGTANRQGWYVGVAVLSVGFGASSDERIGYTPDRDDAARDRSTLWYALLPPGTLRLAGLTINRRRRVIRLDYGSGETFELTFGGFSPSSNSPLTVEERQAARVSAYTHLRTAERLSGTGMTDDAVMHADAARADAQRAGDATLAEWCGRVKAIALVRGGRFDEADALFVRLSHRSRAASEIAWDAGNAYHLAGELPRALAWYRRNFGPVGQPGVGRLKYETIQGIVLALGEMNRWRDARMEIDWFERAYANDVNPWNWYRRYIDWRTGSVPSAPYDPNEGIDFFRYLPLELALARNANAAQLLIDIDRDRAWASETRSLLLMARADALRRLSRIDEAYDCARDAFEFLRSERRTSVLARAHFDLAAERYAALAEMKGRSAEAKQVRAEAAALRWHPNGIHH